MKVNDRVHALQILCGIVDNKSSLTVLSSAKEKASPMTQELCYGVCRHYVRLNAIASSLIKKKPKQTEIWVTLLMGLYQSLVMQVPDYAVVQETVELLSKTKYPWAKGLINATLRNFCRDKERIVAGLAKDEDYLYGHPAWMLSRFKKDWPNDWQEIVKANEAHPPMVLRVNTQKTNRAAYIVRLADAGLSATAHEFAKDAVFLEVPTDVNHLPGFADGDVSIQDAAAQLCVSLLALQEGQTVLDACAAPGGKTCYMLESEPKLKECVAADIDATRLQRVHENLKRLQLHAQVKQQDMLRAFEHWQEGYFDRILLDAPCSAIGVIRRHSDIKLLRNELEVKQIVNIQRDMLRALWPLLAPGGRLLYATCSVLKEENEQQIACFLNEHSDCSMLSLELPWGRATGYGQQILPGEHGMDGFFYSVLIKEPTQTKAAS